jgi:histidine triad (HIT) family protein
MDADCVFCKIVKGEIPSQFVEETDNLVVIEDINPQAPIHLLIVSKKHRLLTFFFNLPIQ